MAQTFLYNLAMIIGSACTIVSLIFITIYVGGQFFKNKPHVKKSHDKLLKSSLLIRLAVISAIIAWGFIIYLILLFPLPWLTFIIIGTIALICIAISLGLIGGFGGGGLSVSTSFGLAIAHNICFPLALLSLLLHAMISFVT